MLGKLMSNTSGGLVGSAGWLGCTSLRVITGVVIAGMLLLGVAASAGAAAPAGVAPTKAVTAKATQSKGPKYKKNLFLQYKTRKTCTVYLNFPKHGVRGDAHPAWSLPADKNIVWRYNASKTWAAVTLPALKKHGQYPWWGFTQRNCLGKSIKQTFTWKKVGDKYVTAKYYPAGRPVPGKIRQGLSGKGNKFKMEWRRVHFNEASALVVRHRVKTCRNATLRDRANFVTGNVPAGWRVHVTSQHRKGNWVKVYVPNAKRWGYIQESATTCHATATASAASAPQAVPPASAPAAPMPPICHWKVTWPAAGVYEEPNRSQPPLKSKHSGDIVGPFCTTYYNTGENETYIQVHTEAAADKVGWMRITAVKPL